jgi:DNA-binding Xre family transcriptional regulator
LNKLREEFYKKPRVFVKDLLNLYNSKIYNLNKTEYYNYVNEIIDNHPSVVNKYFSNSLLYNIKGEVLTIPIYCDYGIIYNSYYMKKEINKIDINKKKNSIYLVIDRETLISYNNSLINIKSLTFDILLEICKKLNIKLDNKKYFKQDLIEIIISELTQLSKKNPNIIYIIKN